MIPLWLRLEIPMTPQSHHEYFKENCFLNWDLVTFYFTVCVSIFWIKPMTFFNISLRPANIRKQQPIWSHKESISTYNIIHTVLKEFAVGTKISYIWKLKQILQTLKMTLQEKNLTHMMKAVSNQIARSADKTCKLISPIHSLLCTFSPSLLKIHPPPPPLYPITLSSLQQPPMTTHWRAHNLGWYGMVWDPESHSLHNTLFHRLGNPLGSSFPNT